MAVTSRPTAKKTSINFGNFGGRGSGGVAGKNQFASIGQTAGNNVKMVDDIIAVEDDVDELSVRAKNIEVTNDALVSQNREFQSSVASIQQRVGALESGQKAILEFQKDKAKIEEKIRKNEEARLKREGAESSLEDDGTKKDIEEKDPKTKKAAKGAMGILDRIKQFFTFVVAGWFTDKTFKLIEAFQTGNKEMINKIGLKLLAGTAAVAGIMAIAVAGIGPVLGGIASLIGTLAGLLFNPVTLTALLIAVGIGGAIWGIRKLFKWGQNKATGGQKFTDKHKKLDQELIDAGMNKFGVRGKNTSRGFKRKGDRTEEQEKIFQKVKAERERLHDLKNKMNAEIEQVVKDTPKSGFAGSRTGRNRSWHTSEDLEIIKKKQDEIRSKYESQIGGGASGDGSNVSAGGKTDFFPEYGPADTGEGNVTVIPNPVLEESTVQKGKKKGVEPLESGNPDNVLTTDAQIQTGMLV